MTWRSRVEVSFSTKDEDGNPVVDRERLVKYLDYLREAWKETLTQLRRSLLLGLFMALVFLILATRALEEISLGWIIVARNSALVVFLPTLAAYFFMEVMIKANHANQQSSVFSECIRLWNPEAWERDLEHSLYPDQPAFFAAVSRQPSPGHRSQFDRVFDRIGMTLMSVIVLVPSAFEIYAFSVLFRTRGSGDWMLWLNVLITLPLVVSYWWLVAAETEAAEPR